MEIRRGHVHRRESGPGQLDYRRLRRFRHVLRLEADPRILDRAQYVALHVVDHRGWATHALHQVRRDQLLRQLLVGRYFLHVQRFIERRQVQRVRGCRARLPGQRGRER